MQYVFRCCAVHTLLEALQQLKTGKKDKLGQEKPTKDQKAHFSWDEPNLSELKVHEKFDVWLG